MCPMCLATAALIAAGTVSTGGLAAIFMKKLSAKHPAANSLQENSHD